MTLTEFLLARIAEDEAAARDAGAAAMTGARWKNYPRDAYEEIVVLAQSKRTLAECEAKRRIVEMYPDGGMSRLGAELPLAYLAAVYSDHPDYRDEWRVSA